MCSTPSRTYHQLCPHPRLSSSFFSMRGGAKVVIEPHRHAGVFVARGKEDALVTLNMNPGKAVYGEKLIKVDNADGTKSEYRVWNPFRSKLAASVLGGVESIYMPPGSKVLYLGAASGTTVSHVSDVVSCGEREGRRARPASLCSRRRRRCCE